MEQAAHLFASFNTALLHSTSLGLFLCFFVGYSIYTFSLVHGKSRTAAQINIVTVIPVAIITFYLLSLPLFNWLSGIEVDANNFSYWLNLLQIDIAAALIVASALQERVRSSSLLLLITLAGVAVTCAHAFTVNTDSWLKLIIGFHDNFGSGALHSVAGGFTLGVLMVLGARLHRWGVPGSTYVPPNNPGFAILGLLLLMPGILGLNYGFVRVSQDFGFTNLYGQPLNLGALVSNNIIAFSAGFLLTACVGKNRILYSLLGGIAGMVAIACSADIYTNEQALLVALLVVSLAYFTCNFLLRRGIDDITGVLFAHGFAGFYGLLISGFIHDPVALSQNLDVSDTSALGQVIGAVIMFFGFGFIPGLLAAALLRSFNVLRLPRRLEVLGGDIFYDQRYAEGLETCIEVDNDIIEQERYGGRASQAINNNN